MAQATGTFTTVDAVGNREDLLDKIFDISPTDCPMQNTSGKAKATAKSTNGRPRVWRLLTLTPHRSTATNTRMLIRLRLLA